jgi:hypothetical protein
MDIDAPVVHVPVVELGPGEPDESPEPHPLSVAYANPTRIGHRFIALLPAPCVMTDRAVLGSSVPRV